jgi:hypothetical protein
MQGREGWEVVAQGACSTPCLPACLPACLLACLHQPLSACLPPCLPACWCAQLLCAAACLLLAPSPARSGAPHLRLHQQQRAAAAEPVQRSPGGAAPAPACTVSEALPACMPGLSAIGWQEARGSRPAGAAPVRLPLPCPAALPWPPLPACLPADTCALGLPFPNCHAQYKPQHALEQHQPCRTGGRSRMLAPSHAVAAAWIAGIVAAHSDACLLL